MTPNAFTTVQIFVLSPGNLNSAWTSLSSRTKGVTSNNSDDPSLIFEVNIG
jgi:hypothetical protein